MDVKLRIIAYGLTFLVDGGYIKNNNLKLLLLDLQSKIAMTRLINHCNGMYIQFNNMKKSLNDLHYNNFIQKDEKNDMNNNNNNNLSFKIEKYLSLIGSISMFIYFYHENRLTISKLDQQNKIFKFNTKLELMTLAKAWLLFNITKLIKLIIKPETANIYNVFAAINDSIMSINWMQDEQFLKSYEVGFLGSFGAICTFLNN